MSEPTEVPHSGYALLPKQHAARGLVPPLRVRTGVVACRELRGEENELGPGTNGPATSKRLAELLPRSERCGRTETHPLGR